METKMNYAKAQRQAMNASENNDCSVKAVAIACDVPYKVAQKALEKQGRKARKGASLGSIQLAVASLGYAMEPVKVNAKTVKTLDREPVVAKGHYMALVNGHILAIKDGVIEDWTDGRRNRILLTYKVTPAFSRSERKALAKQLFV